MCSVLDRSGREDVRLHQSCCANASTVYEGTWTHSPLSLLCITMILRVRRKILKLLRSPTPVTMRLCNSRLPEEHFGYYQTSQRNWVIIKVLYRCLQRYLLSWCISRLGLVTLIVGEVSLGPLGNAHHYKPCKQCD